MKTPGGLERADLVIYHLYSKGMRLEAAIVADTVNLLKEMEETLEEISDMDLLNSTSYHQKNKAKEIVKKLKEWK